MSGWPSEREFAMIRGDAGERVVVPVEVDASRPHPARMYSYWLGGKDWFAADRVAAEQVAQVAPWVVAGARANRAFLRRAVEALAESGIDQFLDLGAGLPSAGNVHEVAQGVNPAALVVYVDNDPVVLAHARALLATDERTVAVAGDFLDPSGILVDPAVRGHLDFSRPVAVLLVAVLHFVPDEADPAGCVAVLRDAVAPGSALALSHVADLSGDRVSEDRRDTGRGRRRRGEASRAAATRAAAEVYTRLAAPFVLRTRAELVGLFDGWELIEPGVVSAQLWRPGLRVGPSVPVLAGVARRPEDPDDA